jgi:hypothetical protein
MGAAWVPGLGPGGPEAVSGWKQGFSTHAHTHTHMCTLCESSCGNMAAGASELPRRCPLNVACLVP